MKVLVTGGSGYKGSVLIPKLLSRGVSVVSVDIEWFGNQLVAHPNLVCIKQDIRDLEYNDLSSCDAIIHLAGVANDPSSDLDPSLTWEIAAYGTLRLADAAVRAGVKQFIYASSASVYGIKEEERIVEDLPLTPVSVYNRSKMVAERILLSYQHQMAVQIVRPATVCGISPRMRLDVAVNLLTSQAVNRGRLRVLGGNQFRPNIHIQDITDVYCWLLENPSLTGIYNAGFENLTVREIAEIIASTTGAEIQFESSNDPRSYRLDSGKLLAAGFKPSFTVRGAIDEIVAAFECRQLIEHDNMYNVNWMRFMLADGKIGPSSL